MSLVLFFKHCEVNLLSSLVCCVVGYRPVGHLIEYLIIGYARHSLTSHQSP